MKIDINSIIVRKPKGQRYIEAMMYFRAYDCTLEEFHQQLFDVCEPLTCNNSIRIMSSDRLEFADQRGS